jgi:hypothetical protein
VVCRISFPVRSIVILGKEIRPENSIDDYKAIEIILWLGHCIAQGLAKNSAKTLRVAACYRRCFFFKQNSSRMR